MRCHHFDELARWPATHGTRRGALFAMLGGTIGVLDLTDVDATATCGESAGGGQCWCMVAAETGNAFCAAGLSIAAACSDCDEAETCVDGCDGLPACAAPCPNPL